MSVKSLGFTLVELMVSVAIMGVLITIGVVSLNKFGSSQKMEETREGFISALRLARNYAITGQNVAGVGGTLSFVSFSIDSNGNVNVFSNIYGNNTYLTKDISPDGAVIGAGTTIRFAAYDGKLVDSDGKSADDDVTFTISAGEEMEDPDEDDLTVTVYSSGLINE